MEATQACHNGAWTKLTRLGIEPQRLRDFYMTRVQLRETESMDAMDTHEHSTGEFRGNRCFPRSVPQAVACLSPQHLIAAGQAKGRTACQPLLLLLLQLLLLAKPLQQHH
eukprot:3729720-Amphidinium_carterae.1